jgi:hypothetical protein
MIAKVMVSLLSSWEGKFHNQIAHPTLLIHSSLLTDIINANSLAYKEKNFFSN